MYSFLIYQFFFRNYYFNYFRLTKNTFSWFWNNWKVNNTIAFIWTYMPITAIFLDFWIWKTLKNLGLFLWGTLSLTNHDPSKSLLLSFLWFASEVSPDGLNSFKALLPFFCPFLLGVCVRSGVVLSSVRPGPHTPESRRWQNKAAV